MTVVAYANTAPSLHPLLTALDTAAHASADAHEAARALTDTVLGCQPLSAEVYRHAPYLSHACQDLAASSRALTVATGHAVANTDAANLHALQRATVDLASATAALRYQTGALAAAASWYNTQSALPPPVSHPPTGQRP